MDMRRTLFQNETKCNPGSRTSSDTAPNDVTMPTLPAGTDPQQDSSKINETKPNRPKTSEIPRVLWDMSGSFKKSSLSFHATTIFAMIQEDSKPPHYYLRGG